MLIHSSESSSVVTVQCAQSNKLNEQQRGTRRDLSDVFALAFISKATYKMPQLFGEGCLKGMPANTTQAEV